MGFLLYLYHILWFLKHHKTGSCVKDAMKSWAAIKNGEQVRCQWCSDQGPAVRYCKNCVKLLDRQCKLFHEKIHPYQLHTTFDITVGVYDFQISNFAPIMFCEDHRHKQLDHYCSSSGILLCEECKENGDFNVDEIEQFFSLQDSIYDTKKLIQEILHTHRNFPENSEMTTMLRWIDVSLGLIHDFEDFAAVPLSQDIRRVLEQEISSSNQVFIRCSDVRDKMEGLQIEMRRKFLSNRRDANEQAIGFSHHPTELLHSIQDGENITDSHTNNESTANVPVLQEADQSQINTNSFEDLHPL